MSKKSLFAILIFSLFFTACNSSRSLVPSPEPSTTPVGTSSATPAAEDQSSSTIELIADTDGQTALELTKAKVETQTKVYDFGELVTGLGGLNADDKHYWALFVNDKYAEGGPSETNLEAGDRIKWVYTELE